MGIITIEDVLEQLIQGKIEDETDRVVVCTPLCEHIQ